MDFNRLDGIDTTRTFCNLLIVLLHAMIAMAYAIPYAGERVFWGIVTMPVAYVAMPTLFYTTGYLTARSLQDNFFMGKFKNRVRRLVVPYVLWNCIFVAMYLITMPVIPSSAFHVEQWHLDTMSGVVSKVFHPIVEPCDSPLWYMRSIFYLFLVSPILLKIIRAKPLIVALGVFVWFGATFYVRADHLFPWYGVAAYCLGMHQHCRGRAFLGLCSRPLVALGVIALIVECATFGLSGREPEPMVDICRVLEIPLVLAVVKKADGWLRGRKGWKMLSEASFFIYASHFLVASLAYHLFRTIVKLRFCQSVTVGVFVYVVGGLALMLLVRAILKKTAPKCLKVLEGR